MLNKKPSTINSLFYENGAMTGAVALDAVIASIIVSLFKSDLLNVTGTPFSNELA